MEENLFFSDDERMLAEIIKEGWDLAWGDVPAIAYEHESQMLNAHTGYIWIYPLTQPMSISTVDFRTMRRTGHVSVKFGTRSRERFYEWGQEIIRILLDNRRCLRLRDNGWTFMEVLSSRIDNDLSGWYSGTIEVRLTAYHHGIVSDGFGKERPPWFVSEAAEPGATDPGECPRPDGSGEPDEGIEDPGVCVQPDGSGEPSPGISDPGVCVQPDGSGEADPGETDPGECAAPDGSGSAEEGPEDPCDS